MREDGARGAGRGCCGKGCLWTSRAQKTQPNPAHLSPARAPPTQARQAHPTPPDPTLICCRGEGVPQAKRYRNKLKPDRKAMLEEKLTASTLFKGKKPTYEASYATRP